MERELLAMLKQHEEAARQRVEELQAELAALHEQIAVAEGDLSDLVATRAPLVCVLAECDAGEIEFGLDHSRARAGVRESAGVLGF